MSYNTLILEHRDHVSWLYFNRPQALNAMSMECMHELRQAFTELRERDETRVIVLSGKGRAFCAGADLGGTMPDPHAPPSREKTFNDIAKEMEDVLNALPKPVIAALNGITCGGGLEMALMCDFMVAAKSARIGDAHANVGAMPGGGATVRLPRVIGPNMAKFLMFTGDLLLAPQMLEMGLLARVYEDAEFETEVQALAAKISSKSPLGLARMKALINDSFDAPTAQALKTEKLISSAHMVSYDASEGGKAFGEKRKPEFRGY